MKNEIPGFLNGKKDTPGQVSMNVLAIVVLFSIGAALAAEEQAIIWQQEEVIGN